MLLLSPLPQEGFHELKSIYKGVKNDYERMGNVDKSVGRDCIGLKMIYIKSYIF